MAKFNALILAKKDSNRLSNKNTRDFKGQPMFLVNVKKCLKIFDEVYVTTNSKEIFQQAEDVGAIGIMRPARLCGEAPNIKVYKHAVKKMRGKFVGIIAVQANSPTIKPAIIEKVVMLMKEPSRRQEVMTCHPDKSIYGSVWALTLKKLGRYGDPYNPQPKLTLVDKSVDIHTLQDLNEALCQK